MVVTLAILAISTFATALHAEIITVKDLRGKTINICDDGAEWPPYTYYKRVNGEATKELVGYSVDVIREIFSKHGIEFTLKISNYSAV